MNYTKIRRATTSSGTLETTIPWEIAKFFKLKEGTILLWAVNGKKITIQKDDLKELAEDFKGL